MLLMLLIYEILQLFILDNRGQVNVIFTQMVVKDLFKEV